VIELDQGGTDQPRENPVQTESPEVRRAHAAFDGPSKAVTSGRATLWAIARERFWDPTLYVRGLCATAIPSAIPI